MPRFDIEAASERTAPQSPGREHTTREGKGAEGMRSARIGEAAARPSLPEPAEAEAGAETCLPDAAGEASWKRAEAAGPAGCEASDKTGSAAPPDKDAAEPPPSGLQAASATSGEPLPLSQPIFVPGPEPLAAGSAAGANGPDIVGEAPRPGADGAALPAGLGSPQGAPEANALQAGPDATGPQEADAIERSARPLSSGEVLHEALAARRDSSAPRPFQAPAGSESTAEAGAEGPAEQPAEDGGSAALPAGEKAGQAPARFIRDGQGPGRHGQGDGLRAAAPRGDRAAEQVLPPALDPGGLSRAASLAPPAGASLAEQTSAAPEVQNVPLGAVPVEIAARTLSGVSRFDITLEPRDLGRIEVRIEIGKGGEVTAQLTVERVETVALLQRDAKMLEAAFDQAGLKTSEGGVQIGLRDEAGHRQGEQHRGQGREDQAGHERPNRPSRPLPEPEPPPPLRTLWRATQGVDLCI